jgi:hypothetical protein
MSSGDPKLLVNQLDRVLNNYSNKKSKQSSQQSSFNFDGNHKSKTPQTSACTSKVSEYHEYRKSMGLK